MSGLSDLRLAWRFAWREMRGGLRGFLIFIACIALGVGAIGGVNSVARAITDSVEREGRALLGGDIRFELVQREANPAEMQFLAAQGEVAASAGMRSMARLPDGSDQTLVEVKAVDGAYPLYGSLITEPALDLDPLLAPSGEIHGAAAAPLLLQRLGLQTGDILHLGSGRFEIRAEIRNEPDLISDGFGLAPRLLISLDGLRESGLVQPGSLIEHRYKIRLKDGSDATLARLAEEARATFPEAGWSIRTRTGAAPALANNVERFSQFLTLVGLTALVVGGVGIANAVRAHLDSKRSVIATLKCLGASGGLVFATYLVQILLIAAIGIAIGLCLATAMPYAAQSLLSGFVPLPSTAGLFPSALAVAAISGVLVTLAFALLPLGRARDVPAADLFREAGPESRGWPRPAHVVAVAMIVSLLAALAVMLAREKQVAIAFIGAVAFSFLVLRLVAALVQAGARHFPSVPWTALRLALGNIHRPGALTPSVVLALGLGLTLLVTLALIDGDLRRQIVGSLPEVAPNFFFVDIQNHEIEAFSQLAATAAPGAKLVRVPMLRGRIMALNDIPVAQMQLPSEGAWVLRGDRGLTYARRIPENSTLAEGEWWAPDHDGPPLVSFSLDEARGLGLKIGDTVTVNVLGRNLVATIANLREVQWESLGINFVMVFSPNSFAGAPHSWLATLTDADATPEQEAELLNAITRAFPAVTSVRVKDALDIVNTVIGQLGNAVRAIAAIALVASILVLSGALAAGNRARIHDAVVLKTLGATRRKLLTAYCLEYALLGLATAIFALLAGGVAARFVVMQIMKLPSQFQLEVAAATILAALVLTVGFGLLGTWRVLGHKAAPILRNL